MSEIFTMTNLGVMVIALIIFNQLNYMSDSSNAHSNTTAAGTAHASYSSISPLWPKGQRYSMLLFVSEHKDILYPKNNIYTDENTKTKTNINTENDDFELDLMQLASSGQLLYRRKLVYSNSITLEQGEGVDMSVSIRVIQGQKHIQSQACSNMKNADEKDEKKAELVNPSDTGGAGAGTDTIYASDRVWSLLRSNQSEVYLQIVLLRDPNSSSDVDADSNSDYYCADTDAYTKLTRKHFASGVAMYQTVQLVKHDIAPVTYQYRYLLNDLEPYLSNFSSYLASSLIRQMTPIEKIQSNIAVGTKVSYWMPHITVNLVTDWTIWRRLSSASASDSGSGSDHVPKHVLQNIVMNENENENEYHQYKPAFTYANNIGIPALLSSNNAFHNGIVLNDSLSCTTVLPLTISLNTVPLRHFVFITTIRDILTNTHIPLEQSQKEEQEQGAASSSGNLSPLISSLSSSVSDKAFNEVAALFNGVSMNMLILACLASALHLFFEMLAFHSDVEFWNATQNVTGLSIRSVIMELISQIIVLLFLMESQTTSLILAPAIVGACIQIWKVWKAVGMIGNTGRARENNDDDDGDDDATLAIETEKRQQKAELEVQAHVEVKKKVAPVEAAATARLLSITAEADRVATQYLVYILMPIVYMYSLYTLVVHMHISWYSWFITAMTTSTYTLGFIFMCPQLYINHQLQSVSHLPWKFLIYKFINTFIDDLFAFIVNMPTLHRISVFRDDLVFMIYLFQRWKYRVDVTRPVQR